jgi:hypothetical protein
MFFGVIAFLLIIVVYFASPLPTAGKFVIFVASVRKYIIG